MYMVKTFEEIYPCIGAAKTGVTGLMSVASFSFFPGFIMVAASEMALSGLLEMSMCR